MVVKTVYFPEELAELIPHYPDLNPRKVKRIQRLKTRKSKFLDEGHIPVMASPPLLVTKNGFILNGKHRATWGVYTGTPSEVYIVRDARDIRYHTPHEAYGETGIEGVMEAYANEDSYIRYCRSNGIYKVKDLVPVLEEKIKEIYH